MPFVLFTFSNQHGREYNTLGIAFSLMFFGTVRHYPANVYEVFLRECQLDEDGERKIQGMTGSTILRMPKFKTEISTKFGFENTVSLESTGGTQKGFGNQLPK